jgi:hypothetical protein
MIVHDVAVTFLDDLRPGPLADALSEATGRAHRSDPVLPRTGGPAGNAVLTAWTGLVLLVLSVAELLTLFNVRGLVSWHVAIGALLIPPALLKTATTGWRLMRYYLGHGPYQEAGPPPMLLRLLGPLVVVSTVGLLGSGTWLVIDGQQNARRALITLPGFRVDWISIHQAIFAVWCVAAGLHLLGRIVPALRLTISRSASGRPDGAVVRSGVLLAAVLLAIGLAVVLVRADDSWRSDGFPRSGLPAPGAAR